MANKQADLTVGIPFHDGTNEAYFTEAIESILEQSVKAKTIHLIQNGNVPPELTLLAEKFKEDYPECIEIIYVQKPGLAAAVNKSIKISQSEFYARMDSDDIVVSNRFELQLAYLQDHPGVNILGGWAREFTSELGKEHFIEKRLPTDPVEMRNWFHYRNPFVHSTIMFRTNLFQDIGYYNETFLTDQDLELWGRAINSNEQIANLPNVLIYFRTDNVIGRRSTWGAILRQAKARWSVKSPSLKLSILKMSALIFRMMPTRVLKFGYKYLRK